MTTPTENTSASDTTVFTSEATQQPQTEVSGGGLINTLVGEGKKFKTVEDLAKGKQESDMFISQLQDELKEMRSALEERTKLQHALDAIEPPRNQSKVEGYPQGSQLDSEELEKIVDSRLALASENKKASENLKAADEMLIAKFNGDKEKAKQFLITKAQELGVGVDFLASAAAKNPHAALHLLGFEAKHTTPNVSTKSSVNTDAPSFTPNGTKEGTKEYFEEIRRTDKHRYFSSKVQQEIFEARKKGTYQTS